MKTQSKLTWDQILTAEHWHPCDLATHTIAQCSADARHDHAVVWGADVLSFCAICAVLIAAARLIERAVSSWRGAPGADSISAPHLHGDGTKPHEVTA